MKSETTAGTATVLCSDTNEHYRFQAPTIGSVVFNPVPVGAGDGETFIAQPVYQHEVAKLREKIGELEARIVQLEAKT